MPSSPWHPWPPAAGAPPPPRAAPTEVSASPWERYPVKDSGSAAAAVALEVEGMHRLPSEDYQSETETQEHEQKVHRYQAMLATRLKAKYFSSKAFEKGDVFEEIVIQSETIQLSRCPFTRLFADPAKFFHEKSDAKNNSRLTAEDLRFLFRT
ncbi:hypothetical protein ACP70R_017667 [Stipagrostis hirtigluma subsp. patula]